MFFFEKKNQKTFVFCALLERTGLIAGVVLAGGEARRLGGVQKALLPLGDRPVIGHLLARLQGQVGAISISANAEIERYARFGFPVLVDGFKGRGPLGGILAGMEWAAAQGAEAVLSVPGDTPFIPRTLAELLAPAPACAASSGVAHWPVALWPTECAAILRAWLTEQTSGRVSGFAAAIGMRRVAIEALEDPFRNINTEADLQAARLSLPGSQP